MVRANTDLNFLWRGILRERSDKSFVLRRGIVRARPSTYKTTNERTVMIQIWGGKFVIDTRTGFVFVV